MITTPRGYQVPETENELEVSLPGLQQTLLQIDQEQTDTEGHQLLSGNPHNTQAEDIAVDASGFVSGLLTPSDDTIQKVVDAIDDRIESYVQTTAPGAVDAKRWALIFG